MMFSHLVILNKFMCISIKKSKKESLFEIKRKECHRLSKILENCKVLLSAKFFNGEKIAIVDN